MIGDAAEKVLMSLLRRNRRVSALIAGAWAVVPAVHFDRVHHCRERCYVTGLPLPLRQCCMDDDVDALDAALDSIHEATSMASVRAAAVLNSVDVLRRLHRVHGHAALMYRDSDRQSALHLACWSGAVDCVRYLMQHAVDGATIPDADGKA